VSARTDSSGDGRRCRGVRLLRRSGSVRGAEPVGEDPPEVPVAIA
jgi:hypothetical protein